MIIENIEGGRSHPTPTQMGLGAPVKSRWVPPLLKMCYQALMLNTRHQIHVVNTQEASALHPHKWSSLGWVLPPLKTNSPQKESEWIKDGLCIYSNGQVNNNIRLWHQNKGQSVVFFFFIFEGWGGWCWVKLYFWCSCTKNACENVVCKMSAILSRP